MGIVVRMEWMSREERDFLLVALLTGYHDAGGWVLDAGTVKDMITAVDLLHAGRLLLEAGIIRGWNEYKGCHWHCYNMMVSAVVGWFSSAFSSVMERMELIREGRRVRHHIYISPSYKSRVSTPSVISLWTLVVLNLSSAASSNTQYEGTVKLRG